MVFHYKQVEKWTKHKGHCFLTLNAGPWSLGEGKPWSKPYHHMQFVSPGEGKGTRSRVEDPSKRRGETEVRASAQADGVGH